MSFRDCIDNAEKEGAISKERADELRALYDENYRQLEMEYGSATAPEAARRTFDAMTAEAWERRRRKLLQASRAEDLAKRQDSFRNLRGEEDPGEFMAALIEDKVGKLKDQSSITQRYAALRGRAHARFADGIVKFERDPLGRTRNKATLANVVREAFGESTGDAAAAALAKSWSDAAEFLRLRFNAAGGHIGKLEKWGLPQHQDAQAVAKAGYEKWRADILPRLDRPRMIDWTTRKPFTDQRLELELRKAFDTITSEGANKITPSFGTVGRMLGNRHAEHRFFIFRSAEDWSAYQGAYGQSDPFASMMHHLDLMARETAEMEVLGPNPLATLRYLGQRAQKWAGLKDASGTKVQTRVSGVYKGWKGYTDATVKTAMQMYGMHTGTANAPANGHVARGFANVRNTLTSTNLGSAFLSAVPSDIYLGRMARKMNGMKETNALKQTVALMAGGDKKGTAEVVRAGLIADGASQVALAQARYLGEVDGTRATRWLADTVLRVSLLSPWTQARRWAFGQEFMGVMAGRAGESIDQLRAGDNLEQAFARALDRYGIAGAWDEIRKTAPYEPEKGATFLRPEDIAARTDIPPERADWLANRVLEMIHTETEHAVPTVSLRGRAALLYNTAPGSFAGELLRSSASYKSFAVTLTQLATERAMQEGAMRAGGYGAAYLANLAVGLTFMGALSVQLKDLKSGRDPRPMDTAEFWGAAMLQGGGVGIFGDFLFASQNRFAGGLGETLAGPVVSFVNDARGLTIGNVQQALSGDDPRVGRDAVRFVRDYTPGGNLWYLDLAKDRMLFDQIQKWADPDAHEDFNRRENFSEREFGSGYWWAPGEALPGRAPALENAAGEFGE